MKKPSLILWGSLGLLLAAAPAAAECLYGGKTYSQGATLCGPDSRLLRCDDGVWLNSLTRCQSLESAKKPKKPKKPKPPKKRETPRHPRKPQRPEPAKPKPIHADGDAQPQ